MKGFKKDGGFDLRTTRGRKMNGCVWKIILFPFTIIKWLGLYVYYVTKWCFIAIYHLWIKWPYKLIKYLIEKVKYLIESRKK